MNRSASVGVNATINSELEGWQESQKLNNPSVQSLPELAHSSTATADPLRMVARVLAQPAHPRRAQGTDPTLCFICYRIRNRQREVQWTSLPFNPFHTADLSDFTVPPFFVCIIRATTAAGVIPSIRFAIPCK